MKTAEQKIAAAIAESIGAALETRTAPPQVTPAFLRPEQAAQRNGVCRRTLSNWTRQGLLPVHRVGRRISLYAVSDLDALIAKFRIGAAP